MNRRIRSWSLALAVFFALTALSSFALSIRVLPGGIPIGDAEQLMADGIRLGNTQLLRQAWDKYSQAVQLHPDFLPAYLQLGRIYFHLSLLSAVSDRDFQEAQQFARKAIQLSPDNPDAHHVMGMVLSGKGKYLDAMAELKLALAMNPANEFVLCDMASVHLAMQQPDETIKMLEGKGLKNGWSYFVLGLAWLQKNEKGRALISFKKAEKTGMTGYWLNMALDGLQHDLSISVPFQKH